MHSPPLMRSQKRFWPLGGLHAWILPNGEIVQCNVKPADLHDLTTSYELNVQWGKYGGPKVIGDKGYC